MAITVSSVGTQRITTLCAIQVLYMRNCKVDNGVPDRHSHRQEEESRGPWINRYTRNNEVVVEC